MTSKTQTLQTGKNQESNIGWHSFFFLNYLGTHKMSNTVCSKNVNFLPYSSNFDPLFLCFSCLLAPRFFLFEKGPADWVRAAGSAGLSVATAAGSAGLSAATAAGRAWLSGNHPNTGHPPNTVTVKGGVWRAVGLKLNLMKESKPWVTKLDWANRLDYANAPPRPANHVDGWELYAGVGMGWVWRRPGEAFFETGPQGY